MSTLQTIKGHISAILKLDTTPGCEDDTQVTESIDYVGQRIWQMHKWPERVKQATILTTAPYVSTSSITVTVTNGSTTLTGSGTTFTAAMEGRKFALGYNNVVYRLATYVSATQFTLARAYQGTTASAQQFVIYQDEIDVATDVDTVEACNLNFNGVEGPIIAVGQGIMDDYSLVQTGTGKPKHVSLCVPTTEGTQRIRVTPVPDAVYALQVTYHKTWATLTSPNAVPGFHKNREWLLIEGGILYAQRLSAAEKQSSEGQLIALADRAWNDSKPHAPIMFQREPWGNRANLASAWLTPGDE